MTTRPPSLAYALAAWLLLWVSVGAGNGPGPVTQPVQQGQEDDWRWSDDDATPLTSAYRAASDCGVSLTLDRSPFPKLIISLTQDGRTLYEWEGHRASVFYVRRGVLYYARFNPTSSGGDIVAVDLTTGKVLWESALLALGPVAHSGYSNRMNLEVHFNEVRVNGWEGYGRYMETKDAKTGQTIRHAVLPVNPPPTTAPVGGR